ncbi:MAG: hypothetical protein NTV33_05570 [Coprothermobacterota bacterium]|nr:hypothetical protein [Coprothermobacterota bacterium]
MTEADRSGKPALLGRHSRGYLPHFDTGLPAGGCLAAGGYRVIKWFSD